MTQDAQLSVETRIRAALKTAPRKFQVRGVRFLERRNGRGIIGDDMGLGKTYQTIAYLKLHPEARPAVIVCPASLKYNWQSEFAKHAGMESDVLDGTKPREPIGGIWVINYDILAAWLPALLEKRPKFMAVDECQKIANRKAKRTIAVRSLGKRCKHVVGLSGTPISNGPVEFFPILNLVARKEVPLFRSFLQYAFKFCNPQMGFGGHWNFKGASNLDELHALIKPFMLRRLKTEVLTELPPKTRTVIPVKIKGNEYRRARDAFIEWLAETHGPAAVKRAKGAQTLVRLGQLRQLAAVGKLPAIREWLDDWKTDRPGQKLVVFGIHKAVISELVKAFPGSDVITGATSLKERDVAVRRFQEDPSRTFLFGNLEAAGVGLTLTAAPATAHLELAWVPKDHEQAEDRVYRIGQTASHVDAFYFVAKGTIDESMMELLEAKRSIVSQVVDGKDVTLAQSYVIEKLLKQKGML